MRSLVEDETIGLEKVCEIAAMSRLNLEDSEVVGIEEALCQIISHMASLQAVETSGIEPMVHALAEPGDMREDEVLPSLDPNLVAENAPDKDGTSFRVPAIIAPGSQKA